ncbi:MAG TPA: YdeI/OmpD-associated family protein [Nitrosopumilaceae archaeon]|jgi:uncharacterized protein YdeI (YjbR/CyaY-like superfamily)|nr:YdeI/OmpD-associated family protein [Nitrosopumilaceae archaeon]
MEPTFFTKQSELRKWFEKNHKKEKELLVGFYKVTSGKPSITWPQSVNEALCVGWIDGIRKSVNKESYSIRFTPRKSDSIWSSVNIKKMEELISQGLMKPAGLISFEKRKEHKSRIYSYEKESVNLSINLEKKFKANKKAWKFFQSMAPSYQKTVIHWIMSAKRDTTKISRLETLMSGSENGQRVKHLNYIAKN